GAGLAAVRRGSPDPAERVGSKVSRRDVNSRRHGRGDLRSNACAGSGDPRTPRVTRAQSRTTVVTELNPESIRSRVGPPGSGAALRTAVQPYRPAAAGAGSAALSHRKRCNQ